MLIERLNQLNLSASQRHLAIENALRAKRFAELFHGLGVVLAKLATVLVVKPVRHGAALVSRHAS